MLKVVHGKDRSGFHGTTKQPAFPKPSEKNEPSELIGDEKSLCQRFITCFLEIFQT
jgi:hypothetical protein